MNIYSEFRRFLPSIRQCDRTSVDNDDSEGRNRGASLCDNYFDSGIAASPLVPTTKFLLSPLFAVDSTHSLCEGSSSSASSSASASAPVTRDHQHESSFDTEYERRRLLRELEEQPCSACKYTGMTLCAGMSLYFLKLAVEESARKSSSAIAKAATASSTSNKVFFYGGAVTWAVAGLYRSVLD
eukprot:CAMPEP_0172409488 /NCGR_PEP_ID=MMETSP1061-20121228/76392_1 /TAXON_ID=37318 /ORGANISM="Pseudo-nitzschia pungens, Strain cf. pungens" /LENGTH=183 /DNA_ID=CAMNT_0013145643 /DNA_START=331 /DNA_END=882 /DNA_ORIENTATION=+